MCLSLASPPNRILARLNVRATLSKKFNDRNRSPGSGPVVRNRTVVAAKLLIEFKPLPAFQVEGTCGGSHRSKMLTSEDHRQLAERCIRLAKECTKPSVAEHLVTLAANYLELAEQALRLREPATAVRRQHIKVMQKE
jgi:hypothetical protein